MHIIVWICNHPETTITLIGTIFTIIGYLIPTLPIKARILLHKLGGAKIVKILMAESAELCGTTGSIKRIYVVNELKDIAKLRNIKISTSTLNLIVEFLYNKMINKV